MGIVVRIIEVLMAAIWSFMWNLVVNVTLPSLSFWDYLAIGGLIGAILNPVVASIRGPMVFALNFFAFVNLQLMGCGF